jgi:hypothetical protein
VLSVYPIVTPVLITPLYVLPYILLKVIHYPIDLYNPGFQIILLYTEKISASIISTLSCLFVYLILKELLNKKIAIIGVLIYAFATNTWAISSQGLWQQGMVELLLSILIYLIILHEREQKNIYIIFIGILSGLFIFNRISDSILLIPVLVYVLSYKNKKIIYYICSAMISAFPFILYNMYYFGNLFGGYSVLLGGFNFSLSTIQNTAGLLISPSRGLFVYMPITLLSILGFYQIRKITNGKLKTFLYFSGLSVILEVLIYGSFVQWWGGGSYGPRFLTATLPILIIYIMLYTKLNIINNINRNFKLFLLTLFIGLLIISVFVQIIGAFYYPNGNWDGSPVSVSENPQRVWDLSDIQILRCFNAGPASTRGPITDLNIVLNYDVPTKLSGWYWQETINGIHYQWMSNNATIGYYSMKDENASISLRLASFYKPRTLQLYENNDLIWNQTITTEFTDINMSVQFKKGYNNIVFYSVDGTYSPQDIPELNNPDSRNLSFIVSDIRVTAN